MNQNEKSGQETAFHVILLKQMNFAYHYLLDFFRHQGSQENIKKAKECSESQIRWKRVFRN